MATQLFFRNAAAANAEYSTGNNDANLRGTATGWEPQPLSLTRGSGVDTGTATTVAGPTAGVETVYISAPLAWISPPLDADITISGSITWNLRAAESSASANASINGRLEVIDGATGAITLIDQTARTVELGTTEAAANFAETPGAGVACKRGDRLRVRVFADDATANMGAGFTVTFWYNGAAGATGDSYLTLTENLTFVSEPAGTQVFPTDTASAVSTAAVDREAWTSRGAGVQTDVTTGVTGWTAPIQVTDTAGGTVVDWFTRPLTAFSLGGAVRVNARVSGSGNSSIRMEIARVAGDGTSPTVWAAGTYVSPAPSTEAAHRFLVSGDDLAISNGQRLRLRFYFDDRATAPMIAGGTLTLYYAGTTGSASGDTYLTFTQTLTEYSAATPVSGTGAGTQVIQTATGSGLETITASGAAIGTASSATGTGTESMTGSGAGSQTVQTASGAGSSLTALTGTGAGTGAAASASGSGDVAALGEITGTGAGLQAAASATGSGLHVLAVTGTGAGVQVAQSGYGTGIGGAEAEVPPGGSSIWFPQRLKLVIGGTGAGTQVSQSAHGVGMVNDDDLVVLAA